MTKRILLFSIVALATSIATDAINRKTLAEYAAGLYGKKKAELKTAVYNLITPQTVLEYGSGAGHTWSGFYTTDRNADNSCIDRYSNDVRYFTSTTNSISGMNIEHSFPKSWWGGTENNAYKDLFNLMPCEAKINTSKSNYGMGVVTNVNTDNGCTKVGKGTGGSSTINLWEPADKWKGDFARGYMYMATAHQNLCSKYTAEGLNSLEKDTWPTLQKWAYTLYLQWSKEDKVSQMETDRNNAVYAIQSNRNLFVDFPTLAEYVWGDSTDVAFNPYTAITTCSDDDRYNSYIDGGDTGGDDEPTAADTILFADFTQSQGDFTINDVSKASGLSSVWAQTSTYGMKASAFYSSTNYAAESWLVSPEIDITNYGNTSLEFSECVNKYFGDIDSEATLWVKVGADGQWEQLSYTHPTISSTWSAFETRDVDVSDYDGMKIYLGFKYVSTSSGAGTWEIKNFLLTGRKNETPDEGDKKLDVYGDVNGDGVVNISDVNAIISVMCGK